MLLGATRKKMSTSLSTRFNLFFMTTKTTANGHCIISIKNNKKQHMYSEEMRIIEFISFFVSVSSVLLKRV